jgi:dTDP-4-dehydrorhamnose reductase
MLGQAVVQAFTGFDGHISLTARSYSDQPLQSKLKLIQFDAEKDDFTSLEAENYDYIVNCIGLIKSKINEHSPASVKAAVDLNFGLPFQLSTLAALTGSKVIQIATDCVFSGRKGNYLETDKHDPEDIYGKTKSLGEIPSNQMMHIRASIIGKENRGHTSLYDWVRLQPRGAEILGFTDHKWNGVTAFAAGQVFRGIIENDLFRAGVHHLIPSDTVTKGELVALIANNENRTDLKIEFGQSHQAVDRTLSSINPEFSSALWVAAGFSTIPSVEDLVDQI